MGCASVHQGHHYFSQKASGEKKRILKIGQDWTDLTISCFIFVDYEVIWGAVIWMWNLNVKFVSKDLINW